jgi:5-bromo-4-chloroindolyl phosphate hydrolysis protein
MYAALPNDRFIYGEKGLLRMPGRQVEDDENSEISNRNNPDRMKSGAFKFFVLINFVFFVASIALCIRGCNDDGPSFVALDEKISRQYQKDIESLRTELEKTKKRLSGFENAMAEFSHDGGIVSWEECCAASRFLPRMEAQRTEKVFPAEYDIFKKIRSCVELANKLKMLDEEGGRK